MKITTEKLYEEILNSKEPVDCEAFFEKIVERMEKQEPICEFDGWHQATIKIRSDEPSAIMNNLRTPELILWVHIGSVLEINVFYRDCDNDDDPDIELFEFMVEGILFERFTKAIEYYKEQYYSQAKSLYTFALNKSVAIMDKVIEGKL